MSGVKQDYQKFNALPAAWIFCQAKDGVEPPAIPKWSGKKEPPSIGSEVQGLMNGLGKGIVRGYFVEYGWLGLLVELTNPPQWWVRQCCKKGKPRPLAHIFGVEFKEDA